MKNERADDEQSPGSGASVPRKLAEWVSLGLSAVIVLSLAGYLVYQGLQPNGPQVPIEVRPLPEEAREENGVHILPVRVTNRGQRTVRDLKVELETRAGGDEPETFDVTLDYLGERSEETVYFHLESNPDALDLKARPTSYRID